MAYRESSQGKGWKGRLIKKACEKDEWISNSGAWKKFYKKLGLKKNLEQIL